MGLIAIALGVGLWGWASDLPGVAVLGMTAGLLHIWNHALMKALMFLAAGSVLHATGERDMEKLGGLLKNMPWTGSAMIVGAVSMTALPPLNGFVSKWLIYLNLMNVGLASSGAQSLTALLAVGLVALVGGLALLTFVRLTGIVLLGSPRSDAARHAHESSAWLFGPMLVLIVLCLVMAVFPGEAITGLSRPITEILGPSVRPSAANIESWGRSLAVVGQVNAGMLIAIGAVGFALLVVSRTGILSQGATWGCGYLQPTARMQYTGRSFAEMIAEHVLPRFLRPTSRRRAPRGLFPVKSDFASVCRDPISEKIYVPFFRRWAERFSRLRILQQGVVHVYLIYIALTVVVALAWVSLRSWWSAS
jgi:NADH:ubiquinone oxidoreductase subunit 5 (subunit L)/multisubunit Na+/H+ antiporter MnhA subunit